MIFIIRGNRHHVKYSCRSDASDRAVGVYIPPSALTAVNALAPISYDLNLTTLIWRFNPLRNRRYSDIPSISLLSRIIYCFDPETSIYLFDPVTRYALLETVVVRRGPRSHA
eukprot:6194067-Pleurochrysis_carterae.AAC.1